MIDPAFWRDRKVFVTGHTGFKGSWLSLWLGHMGARVTGYALAAPTTPSLFEAAAVASGMNSIEGDVRDHGALSGALESDRPDIVLHLAAQSILAESYLDPATTYATNVIGTVNLLDILRRTGGVRAVVIVTSDKCYEVRAADHVYTEDDLLGGADPYSSSKACAELATHAFRDSFFDAAQGLRLASARAGNVIGGGDWAEYRLLPDLIRAYQAGVAAPVRNPDHVRPWQHVLDALHGYLMLAERLFSEDGHDFAGAWNFGPDRESCVLVSVIADKVATLWGGGAWCVEAQCIGAESRELMLASDKARRRLGWRPRLGLDRALELTVGWYRAAQAGQDMRRATLDQIDLFCVSGENSLAEERRWTGNTVL